MSLKAFLFSLGCVLAWFVLLPVVAIGGGASLFLYATLAELTASITGSPGQRLGVQARSTRRLP
jgi:hypothetical protein